MLKIIRTGTNKKAQRETAVYTLVTGRVFTVGRKGSDLCFEDDTSISRSHAQILVEHPLANLGNPSLLPSLTITDLGSKFGTYVNQGIESKVKVSVREPLVLGLTDKFRFGLQWNQYRIEYTSLIVCTSAMKLVSRVKETIGNLGGHYVSDWREDTDLLVMESLVMTIKVVAALVGGKPIVIPDYLHDYLRAVQESSEDAWEVEPMLPNPANYLPPLNERSLTGHDVLFHPDPGRRDIFTGKNFLLPDTKALKNYKSIIENGGGKVDILAKADPLKLTEPGTVVIGDDVDLGESEDPKVRAALATYLASGKRIVAEKELGLAALHQDTSLYLNPMAKRGGGSAISQSLPSQSACSESQDPTQHVFHTNTPLGRSVIPESQKRERDEDSEDEPTPGTSKRRRSDLSTSSVRETQDSEDAETKKRKRLAALFSMSSDEEEEEPMPPPPKTVLSKPAQSPRTTRSQANRTGTQSSLVGVIPATPASQREEPTPSAASAGLRRSPRKQFTTTANSQVVIPATQDSDDDGMVPSGICPASPEFSDEPTLATPRASTSSGNTRRQKRPQEGEAEEAEEEEEPNEARDKKRKILKDCNGDGVPGMSASTVENNVHTNGIQETGTVATNGDVTPLSFKFVSLVVSNGRNPRPQMNDPNQEGVANFKKFRKVSPTFMAPAPIALVPHTAHLFENGEHVRMEPEPILQAPPARTRGRRAQNGHAEPPPVSRPRRNAPSAFRPPAPAMEEEEDEFSFN